MVRTGLFVQMDDPKSVGKAHLDTREIYQTIVERKAKMNT